MTCKPKPTSDQGLDERIVRIRQFVDERDWEQFHSPKNLAMAMIVEAAELVEIFQWMTEEQSLSLDSKNHQRAKEEIADVMVYLLRLADRLDIDVLEAIDSKLAMNQEKYPAHLVRGDSKKYSEYQS